MNFWGITNRFLVLFVLFIFTWVYCFLRLFYSSGVLISTSLIFGSHFAFLLSDNRDLYNALLLYWHFLLHSNTTYDNLWIFCVIIKKFFKKICSWLVAVFLAFRCNHMFANLFIPIFGVYSVTLSSYQELHILSFDIECAIYSFSIPLTVWFCYS